MTGQPRKTLYQVPERQERGQMLAALLSGAWREQPSSPSRTAGEVEAVTPRLLATGAGGLGWWAIRSTPLRTCSAAFRLRQTFRAQALQAVQHEANLEELHERLRKAGVEPLLCKGWSAARLYPDPGLRPYDDFDLFVAPHELRLARETLAALAGRFGWVDLHARITDLADRSWRDLLDRSRLVPLGSTSVRILSAEDQLRHLALHFWRHAAARPLWLCDVAAGLEALPTGFDWEVCLAGDAFRTDWMLRVFGLAQRLLDVRVSLPLPLQRRCEPPAWLIHEVLCRWGGECQHGLSAWRSGSLRALTHRVINPIEVASWERRSVPATLFALLPGACLMRLARLPRRIRSLLRHKAPATTWYDLHAG